MTEVKKAEKKLRHECDYTAPYGKNARCKKHDSETFKNGSVYLCAKAFPELKALRDKNVSS